MLLANLHLNNTSFATTFVSCTQRISPWVTIHSSLDLAHLQSSPLALKSGNKAFTNNTSLT